MDQLNNLETKYPQIKGFLWFNWNNPQLPIIGDWEIESSATAQAAFASAINSNYFSTIVFYSDNDIPSTNNGKIAPIPFIVHNLSISVSADFYQGAPQGVITMDNNLVSQFTVPANAVYANNQWVSLSFSGNWDPNSAHTLYISFTNDLYAGTPQTDRHLYIQSVTFDGNWYSAASIVVSNSAGYSSNNGQVDMLSNGNVVFHIPQ